MNFQNLIDILTETHKSLQGQALRNVDHFLTIRNWMFGRHIVEYEQKGKDRARYGKNLLDLLTAKLKRKNIKGMSSTNLKLFRLFYRCYPQILQGIPVEKICDIRASNGIRQTLSDEFSGMKSLSQKNAQTPSAHSEKRQTVSDILADDYFLKPELLLRHFTFSHFVELIKVDDPLKKAFYETEGIKGNWSVRHLKRQIESLLYERTGLSKSKATLLAKIHNQKDVPVPENIINDPYILEFTGLKERAEYSENDLETALLDHIQEFLLELGNGFCFEARQKRITIDNEHDRIDLVFYHRILQCHVLIDLKNRAFSHADAGQMNFYLNYYKENEMKSGDNPPFGIILCTDKNKVKVKYATTGLDNKLFVSKYLVALPSEKELEEFIRRDREQIGLLKTRANGAKNGTIGMEGKD